MPQVHLPRGFVRADSLRGGFLRPAPRALRRRVPAAFDSDDYDLSEVDGYDSDDYELVEPPAAGARTAAHTSTQEGAPSVSYWQPGTERSERSAASPQFSARPQRRTEAKAALSNGFNLFLLFGAAVDRCMSRFQSAMLTTGAAGQARAAQAQARALAALRASRAGRTAQRWKHNVSDIQRELPEVRCAPSTPFLCRGGGGGAPPSPLLRPVPPSTAAAAPVHRRPPDLAF